MQEALFYSFSLERHVPGGRCHTNQIWPARRLEVPTQVQAAVAARHVWNASSRKTRSVRRDVRWRWTLNVFWTAAWVASPDVV